jgi:hypothetical protein
MITIEYSSICFSEENYSQKIDEARRLVESAGLAFGLQIHNSISRQQLAKLLPYRDELSLSVHSPALGSHFLNLASPDRAAIEQTLSECLPVVEEARSNIFFFHGMFFCDKPIEHNMREYRRVMLAAMGDEFSVDQSFTQSPRVFETAAFAARKQIFRENLAWLKKRLPGMVVALENDFVGVGSGLQRPQELHELVENLWFDVGHFWCSSLLHKFDWTAESLRLIAEKNIVGVHLNHNFSQPDDTPGELRDSHGHLYSEAPQDLRPVVRALRDKGVERFCLEIVGGDIKDVETLLNWLGA